MNRCWGIDGRWFIADTMITCVAVLLQSYYIVSSFDSLLVPYTIFCLTVVDIEPPFVPHREDKLPDFSPSGE